MLMFQKAFWKAIITAVLQSMLFLLHYYIYVVGTFCVSSNIFKLTFPRLGLGRGEIFRSFNRDTSWGPRLSATIKQSSWSDHGVTMPIKDLAQQHNVWRAVCRKIHAGYYWPHSSLVKECLSLVNAAGLWAGRHIASSFPTTAQSHNVSLKVLCWNHASIKAW